MGAGVGVFVGVGVGTAVGEAVGVTVYAGVGVFVGVGVGTAVGVAVATAVGVAIGTTVGAGAGTTVGDASGAGVIAGEVGVTGTTGLGSSQATATIASNKAVTIIIPIDRRPALAGSFITGPASRRLHRLSASLVMPTLLRIYITDDLHGIPCRNSTLVSDGFAAQPTARTYPVQFVAM